MNKRQASKLLYENKKFAALFAKISPYNTIKIRSSRHPAQMHGKFYQTILKTAPMFSRVQEKIYHSTHYACCSYNMPTSKARPYRRAASGDYKLSFIEKVIAGILVHPAMNFYRMCVPRIISNKTILDARLLISSNWRRFLVEGLYAGSNLTVYEEVDNIVRHPLKSFSVGATSATIFYPFDWTLSHRSGNITAIVKSDPKLLLTAWTLASIRESATFQVMRGRNSSIVQDWLCSTASVFGAIGFIHVVNCNNWQQLFSQRKLLNGGIAKSLCRKAILFAGIRFLALQAWKGSEWVTKEISHGISPRSP